MIVQRDSLVRAAKELKSFIYDLAEVGGEERKGSYSAEAKWDNIKIRSTRLCELLEEYLNEKRVEMIITGITILIENDGHGDDDGLPPKVVTMNGNDWKLPEHMFPRDIKLLANIQELVERYNGRIR